MQQAPQGASPNSRFLAGEVPHGSVGFAQWRNSAAGSVIAHLGLVLLFLFVITRPETVSPSPQFTTPSDITWIIQKGPGGGGGGGGNKMPDPPKRTELKGPEKITVPVAPTPKPVLKETPPPPEARLTIPAVPDRLERAGAARDDHEHSHRNGVAWLRHRRWLRHGHRVLAPDLARAQVWVQDQAAALVAGLSVSAHPASCRPTFSSRRSRSTRRKRCARRFRARSKSKPS